MEPVVYLNGIRMRLPNCGGIRGRTIARDKFDIRKCRKPLRNVFFFARLKYINDAICLTIDKYCAIAATLLEREIVYTDFFYCVLVNIGLDFFL
jgi:hypothetical protein